MKGNQLLVGRRRPSGTSLLNRPCVFRTSFIPSISSLYQMIEYRICVTMHVLPKYSHTENSPKMSTDHRFLADVYADEDQGLYSQTNVQLSRCTRSYFHGIPTSALQFGQLSWKVNIFLYSRSRYHFDLFDSKVSPSSPSPSPSDWSSPHRITPDSFKTSRSSYPGR